MKEKAKIHALAQNHLLYALKMRELELHDWIVSEYHQFNVCVVANCYYGWIAQDGVDYNNCESCELQASYREALAAIELATLGLAYDLSDNRKIKCNF